MENETMTTTTPVEATGPAVETTAPGETDAAKGTEELKGKLGQFLDSLFHGGGSAGKKAEAAPEKDPPQEDAPPAKAFTEDDLQAALKAERAKWDAERAEEARRQKLSPEDAAREDEARKDEEITSLKTQLLQKELKDNAVSQLSKDGFPVELADLLDYSGKEKMTESMEKVTQVFQNSLAAALKERLRGKTPAGLGGAANAENNTKDMIAKNIRGGM